MLGYRLKLKKDDNGTFLVTCPAFPEVTTFGETVEDARRRAVGAIEEAIAARMADREPVPMPVEARSGHCAVLPAQAAAKVLLYQRMRRHNVNKSKLARSMRKHRPEVDRLLNLRHGSRLDTIEQAFGVLGARLRIEVEDDPQPPGRAAG